MPIIEDLGLQGSRVIAVVGAGGKTSLIRALGRAFHERGQRVLATTTTKVAAEEFDQDWRCVRYEGPSCLSDHDFAEPLFTYAGTLPELGKWTGLDGSDIDAIAKAGLFDRILIEADGARRCAVKAPAPHEPVIPASADTVVLVAGLGAMGKAVTDDVVFRSQLWSQLAGDVVTPEGLWTIATDERAYGRALKPACHRVLYLNQDDAPGSMETVRQLTAIASEKPAFFHILAAGRLKPVPAISWVWTAKRVS